MDPVSAPTLPDVDLEALWALRGPVAHGVCMGCFQRGQPPPWEAACGATIEDHQPADWPHCAACEATRVCSRCGARLVTAVEM
jgi:hypothetical protein